MSKKHSRVVHLILLNFWESLLGARYGHWFQRALISFLLGFVSKVRWKPWTNLTDNCDAAASHWFEPLGAGANELYKL